MAASSSQNVSLDRVLLEITSTNNLGALNQTLRGFAPKDVRESLLASSLPNGQDPLAVLEIERHTLGALYILSARFLVSQNGNLLPPFNYIEQFCRTFDPRQAVWAPDRMNIVAKGLVALAEGLNSPKLPLTCLYHIVHRYAPSPAHLTPIHPLFISACVASQHFDLALDVLRTPATEIDPNMDLQYNDNLVYHYAGGIALAALKKWDEAAEFFEICVTSPAQVPAAIQLDAYKKLVLVQLISRGATSSVPKYTHPVLTRMIKSSPYFTLAKNYPQSASSLRPIIEKEIAIFTNDNNLGLIDQALERAPRWLIKKLTSTYLTLGLADIGKSVGIPDVSEVRATILSMIEQDEICATISADETVTFSDPPSKFSKSEIDRLLVEAQRQGAHLAALDRDLGKSKEFITKVSKNKEDWAPQDEELFATGAGAGTWMDEGY